MDCCKNWCLEHHPFPISGITPSLNLSYPFLQIPPCRSSSAQPQLPPGSCSATSLLSQSHSSGGWGGSTAEQRVQPGHPATCLVQGNSGVSAWLDFITLDHTQDCVTGASGKALKQRKKHNTAQALVEPQPPREDTFCTVKISLFQAEGMQ